MPSRIGPGMLRALDGLADGCYHGDMNKNSDALSGLLAGAAVLGIGLWLASNPRCEGGCKTVAEHLIEHSIPQLLRGLLA